MKKSKRPSREQERDVAIVGNQLRARVDAPAKFEKFYTENLEDDKSVQRVMGIKAQSYRVNLKRATKKKAKKAIEDFPLTKPEEKRAKKLVEEWHEFYR